MSENAGNKDFDGFFKNQFGDRGVPPPNELWDKVNKSASVPEDAAFDKVFQEKFSGAVANPPSNLWFKVAAQNGIGKIGFFASYFTVVKWIAISIFIATLGVFGLNFLKNEKVKSAESKEIKIEKNEVLKLKGASNHNSKGTQSKSAEEIIIDNSLTQNNTSSEKENSINGEKSNQEEILNDIQVAQNSILEVTKSDGKLISKKESPVSMLNPSSKKGDIPSNAKTNPQSIEAKTSFIEENTPNEYETNEVSGEALILNSIDVTEVFSEISKEPKNEIIEDKSIKSIKEKQEKAQLENEEKQNELAEETNSMPTGIDKNDELSEKLNIKSVPTFFLYKQKEYISQCGGSDIKKVKDLLMNVN